MGSSSLVHMSRLVIHLHFFPSVPGSGDHNTLAAPPTCGFAHKCNLFVQMSYCFICFPLDVPIRNALLLLLFLMLLMLIKKQGVAPLVHLFSYAFGPGRFDENLKTHCDYGFLSCSKHQVGEAFKSVQTSNKVYSRSK